MKKRGRQSNKSRAGTGVYPLHVGPKVTTDESQGVRKGSFPFVVPGCLAHGQRLVLAETVRQQGDQGEEAQQRRGGAGNSQVRPLPLGFQTQMSTRFLEGHFQAPATDKEAQNLLRAQGQVGADKGGGQEVALRVAHQHPADGQGVLSLCAPQGGLRTELDGLPLVAVPVQVQRRPLSLRVGQHLLERGQALAFLGPLPRWRVMQDNVQAGSGDVSHIQAATALPQLHSRQAAVHHQHDSPPRQPAPHRGNHLPNPVDARLVPLFVLRIGLGSRGQDGQKGQGPAAAAPGRGHTQHHRYPTQGWREVPVVLAGPFAIAEDTLVPYLGAPAPFHRLVSSQHYRSASRHKGFYQQAQQNRADLKGRPPGPIEHTVVVLELTLVFQAHHVQDGRHRSFARRQNRARHQYLHQVPNARPENLRKGGQYGHNLGWQDKHTISPCLVKSAYLAAFFCQPFG